MQRQENKKNDLPNELISSINRFSTHNDQIQLSKTNHFFRNEYKIDLIAKLESFPIHKPATEQVNYIIENKISFRYLQIHHLETAHTLLTYILNKCPQELKKLDLRGVDFRRIDLRGADLSNLDLSSCNFRGMNLTISLRIYNERFIGINFTNSNLSFADLRETHMYGCNVTNTQLCYANLSSSEINWWKWDGVNILGADFSVTKFSSDVFEDLKARITYSEYKHTRMPFGKPDYIYSLSEVFCHYQEEVDYSLFTCRYKHYELVAEYIDDSFNFNTFPKTTRGIRFAQEAMLELQQIIPDKAMTKRLKWFIWNHKNVPDVYKLYETLKLKGAFDAVFHANMSDWKLNRERWLDKQVLRPIVDAGCGKASVAAYLGR